MPATVSLLQLFSRQEDPRKARGLRQLFGRIASLKHSWNARSPALN